MACSYTLKKEAACSYETLVPFYYIIWCCNLEDTNLHILHLGTSNLTMYLLNKALMPFYPSSDYAVAMVTNVLGLSDKLIVAQLAKKFSDFCATQRFLIF